VVFIFVYLFFKENLKFIPQFVFLLSLIHILSNHQNYNFLAQFDNHRTTLSGYIFATKACIDNRKKLVKQQYLLHMSPQYGELRPTIG